MMRAKRAKARPGNKFRLCPAWVLSDPALKAGWGYYDSWEKTMRQLFI